MYRLITAVTLSILSFSTVASDIGNVPAKKQTPQGLYMTAQEAYDSRIKNSLGSFFVDVRTRAEVEFVGMTDMVDANIPYLVHENDSWDGDRNVFASVPNSNFSLAFEEKLEEKGFTRDSTIILMCRSGTRSSKAANLLSQLGYKNVYSVVDGFEGDKAKEGVNKGQRVVNGWKNANLPWSYKLAENKMYFE